jgi:hypothetical protein
MSEFNIDPAFSVYRLVQRNNKNSVLNHRRTMSIISYEIENASLVDDASTVVFSSFQRMSKFLPQEARYRRLADIARHVYVFGVPDTDLPEIENVTCVPLKPEDQLAKEWFLVSYSEDYFSALATEELTDIDDPDPERIFKGVWTFDLSLVSILHEWLSGLVGLRFEQRTFESHDLDNQLRLMGNTIGRMAVRSLDTGNESEDVQKELRKLIETGVYPALENLKSEGKLATQELVETQLRALRT